MASIDKVVKIGFILQASDKMTRVIEGAVQESLKSINKLERRAALLGKSTLMFGKRATAMGAALAGAMFASAKSVATYGDSVLDASQKTGLGIETYQKFAYAAERCNVSADSFSGSITKLNKKLIEVREKGIKATTIFRDLNIRTDDVKNTLLDTAKIFARAKDGPGKVAAAMELFGKSGADLIPFLNQGEQGIEALMEQAVKLGLVLDDKAILAADDFDTKLNDLNSTITGAYRQIGSLLIPTFQNLVVKIQNVVVRLMAWVKANPDLVNKIIGWTTSVAKSLLYVGLLSTALGWLAAAFLKVVRVVRFLKAVFAATKVAIGAIQVAMAGLKGTTVAINGATKAYAVTQGVSNTATLQGIAFTKAHAAGQKIAAAAQWVWNGAITAGKAVMAGFAAVFSGIKFAAMATGAKIAAAAQWLFNTSLYGCPVVWIIAGIAAIVAAVYLLIKHWDKVSAFFAWLWDNIKSVFSAAWEWIKNMFLDYTPHGLIIKHWDKITAWFSNLWEIVKQVHIQAWEKIKEFFGSLNPVEWFVSIFESVKTWFADLNRTFFDFGKNIVTGLIDGIKSMFTKVFDTVGNIGAGIKDTFTNLLGIKSPSTIFADFGLNITKGLTLGIERGESDSAQATESLAMQVMRGSGGTNSNVVNSSSFGGVTINYSPVLNVSNVPGGTQDILSALRQHKNELMRLFDDTMQNRRRLAFADY